MKQCPQQMLNGITTRSPAVRSLTSLPISSTTPMASWPRMSPGLMNAPSTSYRCRSDPQMLVLVTLMIASVGSLITGSGTVSTDTCRRPCHVTALIGILLDIALHEGVPNHEVAKPLAISLPRPNTRQRARGRRPDSAGVARARGLRHLGYRRQHPKLRYLLDNRVDPRPTPDEPIRRNQPSSS